MERMRSYIAPILVLTLFIVSYYPALASLVQKWSASEDYAHAFFTVPIVAYMFWQKRHILEEGTGWHGTGLLLFVGSLLLYLVSLQLQIPTIMYVATVSTVVSALIFFGGIKVLWKMAIPIILLFMVIPIPNQMLSMVTASLQLRVSEASEVIIRLFSVPLFREGNILQVPDKVFQVVEACSGIRSLISLTTLSLIIGYFTLKRWSSTALLLLFSIPVAIVVNIIRVVSLVLIYYFFRIDLSAGTAHTFSGLMLFVLGLGLLFGFQRVLELWERKKS